MTAPVFVASGFVAKYPNGGGSFWIPLQYLLGLRDLEIDAYWIELLAGTGNEATDRWFRESFLQYADDVGARDRIVLVVCPDGFDSPERREVYGMDPTELRARCRDALLLNLAHTVPKNLRPEFGRTVLFDVDPGPFQIWAQQFDFGLGSHDAYLTIGQNLGAADSPIPLGDVDWQRTWPAVHLPSWPVQATAGGCYTTVTQWWSQEYAFVGDEAFDCNKRNSFIEFVDLPAHTAAKLELAANIHPSETDDIALFASKGWRLAQPEVIAQTPLRFRDYVQASRGEWGCAKPAYVKARPGWVSDRTLCYLASGRPCVVQDTGAARHLPESLGLQFFATVDEAADALNRVERDYATAASDARRLAESVFGTAVVIPGILKSAGF